MFRVFRFTIREIILITIIVALALGWWVDRRELARLRRIEIQEYTAIRNMAARMTSAIKTKLHLEIDTKPTGPGPAHQNDAVCRT